MVSSVILFDSSSTPYQIGGLDLVCPEMEWNNLVALTDGPSEFSREMQGTLSIKCVFGGEEVYKVKGEQFRITPQRFLVLNCGRRYTSRVEKGKHPESLCLFFHPRFVEGALQSLVEPEDHLLDMPFDDFGQPIRFVEQLYAADSMIFPRLLHLRSRMLNRKEVGISQEWLNQEFHQLLGLLMGSHRDIARRMRTLNVMRPATRLELYRRLELARAFIQENYTRRILLSDIASAAFLSSYYLLRMFRQVYQETPHQYMTKLRIERAAYLLAHTDSSVTDICLDLGFDSPNTFSLLFRRYQGVSPRGYRGLHKREAKDQGEE